MNYEEIIEEIRKESELKEKKLMDWLMHIPRSPRGLGILEQATIDRREINKKDMKWYSRDITPQREATLILARFEEDRLEDLQIGRAQYFEGEFQIWSNDRECCHHGQVLPKKFTHWTYEDEYWKLLEKELIKLY